MKERESGGSQGIKRKENNSKNSKKKKRQKRNGKTKKQKKKEKKSERVVGQYTAKAARGRGGARIRGEKGKKKAGKTIPLKSRRFSFFFLLSLFTSCFSLSLLLLLLPDIAMLIMI